MSMEIILRPLYRSLQRRACEVQWAAGKQRHCLTGVVLSTEGVPAQRDVTVKGGSSSVFAIW